jgi:hypothetical protein
MLVCFTVGQMLPDADRAAGDIEFVGDSWLDGSSGPPPFSVPNTRSTGRRTTRGDRPEITLERAPSLHPPMLPPPISEFVTTVTSQTSDRCRVQTPGRSRTPELETSSPRKSASNCKDKEITVKTEPVVEDSACSNNGASNDDSPNHSPPPSLATDGVNSREVCVNRSPVAPAMITR